MSLLGLVLVAACTDGPNKAAAAKARFAAVPVVIGRVETRSIPLQLEAVGTVEPLATADVRPQVGGFVAKAAFREGQEVRRGELLYRLDDRPFVAALRQTEAALARDQAQEEAAARDAARYEELLKRKLVSLAERDHAVAQAEALGASVKLDEAAVAAARLQVSYCTIRSPIDGRTGPLLVKPGNVVKANDSILVTVHQMRPTRVAFPIPESRLPDVRARMAGGAITVLARPEGDQGAPVSGRLTFLMNEVDRTTGTVLLKATFDNHDGRLWPGQFVRVTMILGMLTDATVVPSQAVQEGQHGSFVFVVRPDSTAELRNVVVGPSASAFTVVRQGLTKDEQVVVDGQVRVAPGTKVRATRVPPAAPSAAEPRGAPAEQSRK